MTTTAYISQIRLMRDEVPSFAAYPNAYIYALTEDGVRRQDYYDTEHYRVTRDFLAEPKRMLRVLMEG